MNSDFIVAVHALVFLRHKQDVRSSVDIAENVCTNPVRIRRVMSGLCKAGLVESRRGQQNSGYIYEKGRTITLSQVADAFGEALVEVGWRSGESGANCPICAGMASYTDGLYAAMNRRCLDYLETITIEDVEHDLFQRRGLGK